MDGTFQVAIKDKGERRCTLTQFDFKADFCPTVVDATLASIWG
jgi:hypothetical protein